MGLKVILRLAVIVQSTLAKQNSQNSNFTEKGSLLLSTFFLLLVIPLQRTLLQRRAFGNSQFDKASLSLFSLGRSEQSSRRARKRVASEYRMREKSGSQQFLFLLLPQYGHQFVTGRKMDSTLCWTTRWPLFILIWYSIDIVEQYPLNMENIIPRLLFFSGKTFQSSKCCYFSMPGFLLSNCSQSTKPILKVDLNMSMRLTSYDAQCTIFC